MNRVVVSRAAAGLAQYLRDEGQDGAPVVIGYDARYNSDIFARDTAEIVAGAGFRALLCPRPLPTPVLAGAIRHLGAAAGVVVTASHNPPQDNGYKVYLGDGGADRPPGRRPDRGLHRGRRTGGGHPAQRRRRHRSTRTWSTPTWPGCAAWLCRAGPGTSQWSTPRCTASGATVDEAR